MLELRQQYWFSTPYGEARALILLDYVRCYDKVER